jgi:hypothetical protein
MGQDLAANSYQQSAKTKSQKPKADLENRTLGLKLNSKQLTANS